jgi:hypothetical protein
MRSERPYGVMPGLFDVRMTPPRYRAADPGSAYVAAVFDTSG